MSADSALLTPSCRVPSGLAEEDHQDSNLLDDVFRAARPADDDDDGLGSSSCEPSSPLSPIASGSRLNEDFNEKLGVFARSLAGSCSGSATKVSPGFTDLDSVVQERARQKAVATSAAAAARLPADTSARVCQSDEDQINDETVQQSVFSNAHITEVFDPSFKFCFEVPTATVVHLPPARLNITRLVFCRNYQPGNPTSCAMGDGCKFVHADVDFRVLEAHSIHVKYSWRSEHVCIYARLPAGEVLHVSSPNNRPPVEDIPSERVLVTRGSLRRKEDGVQLSHCAHYHFNRMCNRGERCNFIHSVHVDPNVPGDFKRAPCCKAGSGSSVGAPKAAPSAAEDVNDSTLLVKATELTQKKSVPNPLSPPWNPSGAVSQPVMPQQPGYLSYPGSHAGAHVTGSPAMMQAGTTSHQQYGMVVFVPCDAAIAPTIVSPGILSPSAIGGPPALSILPAATLDLMHAAFPGLASRWSIPGGDPATSAVAALAGGGAGATHYHHPPHQPAEGANWVSFGNAQGVNVTAGGAPTAASYPFHGMLPMDAPNSRRPATRGLRNSMR